MLSRLLSLILFLGLPLFLPVSGICQIFATFNATDLQAALTTAQSNGEADTILLAPHRYDVVTELTYNSIENYGLTILGMGDSSGTSNRTVLDGLYNSRIMNIRNIGSIYDTVQQVTIRNISFKNARSGSGIAAGLLIQTDEDNITVEDCVFQNNLTESKIGGASLVTTGGVIRMYNSVFDTNAAEGNSIGALRVQVTDGEIYLVNNTIINNSAIIGAGIQISVYNASTRVIIANNIIHNNTYESSPKDLQMLCSTTMTLAHLSIRNNIFTQDSPNNIYVSQCESPFIGYNLFADPLLDETYHLTRSSPAIDMGTGLVVYKIQDIDGDQRPKDGNRDEIAQVDIGVDEFINTSFPWNLFLPAITNAR